ncbi:MAG TPA: hypothetical protein VHT00_01210 [Stellaceae bacterium]|jgi:hypothetical protein|nr:hypothetical protein [Stellaceae bacterium]
MSIAEPPFITRGKLRAAARALNQLADAEPRVEPAQVRAAFARAGVIRKSAKARPEWPASPPEPEPEEPAHAAAPREAPRARGPPEPPALQPIWVRTATGARLAGVGLSLFNRWIASSRVISKKVGGVRLVLVSSIYDIPDDPVASCRPGPHAHRKIPADGG